MSSPDRSTLQLWQPGVDDVAAIHRACQDPLVQRFTRVPTPYRREHAEGFVRMVAEAAEAGASVVRLWSAGPRDDLGGCVGVELDGHGNGEVGYWTAPAARGRGDTTRAVAALLRTVLAEHRVASLELQATNPRSEAIARRLGFRHVGTRRAAHHDGPSGDPDAPRDDVEVFDLLPGELIDP